MERGEGCTFLFDHRCKACGSPIAMRHEAIGEDIIKLDALASDADVNGELCPLYCPACLAEVLEINGLGARLRELDNITHNIDIILGKTST